MAYFAKRARIMQNKLTLELVGPKRVAMTGDVQREFLDIFGDDERVEVVSRRHVIFPLKYYDSVVAAARNVDGVNLSLVPPVVFKLMAERLGDDAEPVMARLPKKMRGDILPFQIEGVQKGVQLEGSILFADEMGLGKTMQALGTLALIRPDKTLVVCPTSLGQHWCNEVRKWTKFTAKWLSKGNQKWSYNDADVFVVSYGLVGIEGRTKYVEIAGKRWDCVVLDESHSLQDRNSKRSKCLAPLIRRANAKIFISGTPIRARPEQLYTQLSLLFPQFMTWSDYALRYCENHKDERFGCWDSSGSACTTELANLIATRSVRRLKRDVLKDLPPKRRVMRRLTFPPLALDDYKIAKADFDAALTTLDEACNLPPSSEARKKARDALFQVNFHRTECHRATARVKAPQIGDIVVEIVRRVWDDEGRNVAVFAHHGVMIKALVAALEAAEIDHIVIDGKTPIAKRQGLVDRVASVGDAPVCAVLSILACGVGLNFTPGVSHEIFAELDWTPANMLQAEDRAHRMGAKAKEIVCEYFVAEGTDDDAMLKKLESKFQVTSDCVDGVTDAPTKTKGFAMHAVSSQAYRGHELFVYGVQLGAADVHVTTYPIKKESLDAFVKRCTVKIAAEDSELFDPVDDRTLALNVVNSDAKSKWVNAREWGGDHEALDSTEVWVLLSAPLVEIEKMQAEKNGYRRAEATKLWTTCAVYVPRLPQGKDPL